MDDQSNSKKGYYTYDRTTMETNNVEEIISSTLNSLTAHSGPLVAQFNLDYAHAVCVNVLKSLQVRATSQENNTMMLPLPSTTADQGCIDAVALATQAFITDQSMGVPNVVDQSNNGINYSNSHGVISSSGPAFQISPLDGTLSTIRNDVQDQDFDIRLPDKPADDEPTVANAPMKSDTPSTDLHQKHALGQSARTALDELYLSDSDVED